MKPKKLAILGSTGSIGRSTFDVVRQHPGQFEVVALSAHANVELICSQYSEFHPKVLCLTDDNSTCIVAERLKAEPVEIISGETGLLEVVGSDEVETVVNAIVGAAGLKVSLETVKLGKMLALANKESLVTGGPLFGPLLKKSGAKILPIDSEHSAIWQSLACGRPGEVRKIILTASGGPFRDYPAEKFSEITLEMALAHPTWKMGPKITIDSATLANKGLEVIEAVALFSVPAEKVEVVVHPQSIIHSMVEFVDSSIIGQLSTPDMRLPITYALFWPERVESGFGRLDLTEISQLTFEKPDFDKFPLLKLAYQVAETGGTAPAVFNAANEVAVEAFLDKTVRFVAIADIVDEAIDKLNIVSAPTLEDILAADRLARETARGTIKELTTC